MHVAAEAPRPLNVRQNLALSFLWFTSNVVWTALIIILVPAIVRGYVGDARSGTTMSVINAAGALLATLAQPLFGALSDRTMHPWGRRRPFIFVGILLSAAILVWMGSTTSVWEFGLAFFCLEIVANFGAAPYQALIPDIVLPQQRGTASGYMGLMNQAAIIVGVLLPSHLGVRATFEVLAALQIVGMVVTLAGVPEVPLKVRIPFAWKPFLKAFWLSPRDYPDWWWVFGTRLLVLLGFATLEYYLYYYLVYVQHLTNPNGYLVQILLLVTVGSLLSVLTAGWLSDRLQRRKIMVTLGGLFMGLAAMGFVLAHSLTLILALAFLFGVGYGTYLSTDWALAVDVLPKTGNAAKDMGLWAISQTISQTIANILGGLLLVVLEARVGLAASYRILYLLTFIYFLAGSVLVGRVRSSR